MKNRTRLYLIILAALLIIALIERADVLEMMSFLSQKSEANKAVDIPPIQEPSITHQQETWIRALEWCESNGSVEAINPKDLDDTPSYGAFQFKPSTFDYFAKLYDVSGELMDREAQYQIVKNMVLNRDKIAWSRQFSSCVRKLGYPPVNKPLSTPSS